LICGIRGALGWEMKRAGVHGIVVDEGVVFVSATSQVRNYLLAGGFKPERRWFFEFLIPLVLEFCRSLICGTTGPPG
jgi:hypothetical protein